MNELTTNFRLEVEQNKTELSVRKQRQVEYVLEGVFKPKPGHSIWEINEETGEIKKAEFKRNTASFDNSKIPAEELIKKADCIYIPALNKDNAKNKYLNNKEQSHYYAKKPPMSLSEII